MGCGQGAAEHRGGQETARAPWSTKQFLLPHIPPSAWGCAVAVLIAQARESEGLEATHRVNRRRGGGSGPRATSCKHPILQEGHALLFTHQPRNMQPPLPSTPQHEEPAKALYPGSPWEGWVPSSERPASSRCVLRPVLPGKDRLISGIGCGSWHWTLTGRMPSACRWPPGHLHFPAVAG